MHRTADPSPGRRARARDPGACCRARTERQRLGCRRSRRGREPGPGRLGVGANAGPARARRSAHATARRTSRGSPRSTPGRASTEGRRQPHAAVASRLGRARLSVFCDSSALVKLYADEPGAGDVRRLPNLVVSGLARVEVPSALWRKHRLGELSAADAAVLVEQFEWDWFGEPSREPVFAVLDVSAEILEEAARSVARHPLRAFDAVQLASALVARAADSGLTAFACFDETLLDSARAEGFNCLP